MEEKKINKRIVFSVVAVLLLIAVVAGATYAYFSAGRSSGVQTVTTASLDIDFDDSSDMINTPLTPLTTDKVLTKAAKKTFTIKKVENADSNFYAKISLTELNVPEALAKYDLKWALYQGTTPIATGDFGGKTSGSIVMATNQYINSTTGLSYDLYLWINETGLEQNAMQGQTFSAKITATASITKANTLASVILGENNSNVITSTPTFSIETTDRGLYVQQGDVTKSEMGFPTYFYKGSTTHSSYNPSYVMNNYVKFGKYQTADGGNTVGNDIVWRIVRINEDGSIKLLNENGLAGTAYNLDYDAADAHKYVLDNGLDSNIKSYVETWYSNNIGNTTLDNKVVKSTFCDTKTFTCPADKTKVYEKIGLLTYGEVYYAGGGDWPTGGNSPYFDKGNDFYFLSDNTNINAGIPYWQYSMIWTGASDYDLPARVVINLSPDVEVLSGDGLSANTAYIIK